MAFTPEQTARLLAIQRKVLEGTDTPEDIKEGIIILRQDRVGAQHASTKARGTAATARAVVDPTKLLADLMKSPSIQPPQKEL